MDGPHFAGEDHSVASRGGISLEGIVSFFVYYWSFLFLLVFWVFSGCRGKGGKLV